MSTACHVRERSKLEEFEASHTLGGKVVSREREVERRREVWSGRGECARAEIGVPSS